MTTLASTVRDRVCYLELVPPEGKPPTLDLSVLEQLEREIARVQRQAAQLAAVVVQSRSRKHFCAGANIQVLGTLTADTIGAWVRRGHDVLNALERLPLPVIARVDGYAMGGGLELAMACDLIVASTDARFAQSEVSLGFVTGWGGSARLVRRVGVAKAKELSFTGRMVEPDEAVRIGLIDQSSAPAELDQALERWLAPIRQNSRVAIREMKTLLSAPAERGPELLATAEVESSQRCLIEGDTLQRLRDFFAARAARKSAASS